MNQVIKAPNNIPKSVFLAGSIEMGSGVDWQEQATRELDNCIILNPRRDDWDSSWTQSIENKQFKTQVEWELNALDKCDIILMYFDPKTKSPISLLELGLYANSKKLFVCCPDGFWRKGNVDIVCEKYNIFTKNTLEDLIEHVNLYL